jgi:hypothetical protein
MTTTPYNGLKKILRSVNRMHVGIYRRSAGKLAGVIVS